VECRVVPPHPPRRRRKKLQEKDLLERLKKYESLLNDNGVKFDPIGKDIRDDGEDGRMEDVDELENDFEDLKTDGETSASPSATSRFNKLVLLLEPPCCSSLISLVCQGWPETVQ
jgi:hypothetical protein